MANYCRYEVHARGDKKAALYLRCLMQSAGLLEITHEEDTAEGYVVWMRGDCNGSLSAYCKEGDDAALLDYESMEEGDLRTACDDGNWYMTMRQKSELLDLELQVQEWSSESGFNNFSHYDRGECVYEEDDIFDPDYVDNYEFDF